jgi:hypothetical protein
MTWLNLSNHHVTNSEGEFVSLFREGQRTNRLDNGKLARSKAPEILSHKGIAFETGNSQAAIQNGAKIGVAFYSLRDLEFLDQLMTSSRIPKTIVVFDVLSCETMADFEKFIPGIGPVHQTPVVGIWKDGQLARKGVGARGRDLLSSL